MLLMKNPQKVTAGDRVWIGRGQSPRSNGLAEVTRVTATQIVVQREHGEQRFNRMNGFSRGGGTISSYISGIATLHDRADWDKTQAEKSALALQQRSEQERRETVRTELGATFGDPHYVSIDHSGQIDVTLRDMSEAELRQVAELVRQFPSRQGVSR